MNSNFPYNTCEKCGDDDKDTAMYNISIAADVAAQQGGLPVRLYGKCARDLKSDMHTFVKTWLRKKESELV